ncbi:hypothetical protein B7463_g11519, partial [Scytalidium lignicola]
MPYQRQNGKYISNLSTINRNVDPVSKPKNNLWSDNPSLLKVDPEFMTGSPDESLDSGLFSVSDSSEQAASLDSNESAYPLLKTLLCKLLTGFQNTTQCQSSSSRNGNEQGLERHLDLETCPRNDPAILEGISHHQQRQLTRKSKSSLSEENQWFAIWEILFPGRQRPISAYVEAGLSMQMRRFREYCSTHGPSTLAALIESDPTLSGPETTENNAECISRKDSPREEQTLSSGRDNSLQPMQLETPGNSNSDSGAVLGSPLSFRQTASSMSMLSESPNMTDLSYEDTSPIQDGIEDQSRELDLLDISGGDPFQDQLYDPAFSTIEQLHNEFDLDFSQLCQDFQDEDCLVKS